MHPYIGVTGFNNREQVYAALRALPDTSQHKLMVGVLGSDRTLLHREPHRRFARRYPAAIDIANIFVRDRRCLNFIHYNTHNPERIVEEVDDVVAIGGPLLHGLQLNVASPKPDWFAEIKQRHPKLLLVLQLNKSVMHNTHGQVLTPREIALKAYTFEADYVLVDRSGGTGTMVDDIACKVVKELYDISATAPQKLQVGIAGGLSAETLGYIAPTVRDHPDICLDAESRLRDDSDRLIELAVQKYILAADQLLAATAAK